MPNLGPIISDVPDIPNGVSVGRIVFERMKTFDPKSIAAVDAVTKTKITYGEFFENCAKVAVHLKKCGVKIGDNILIISENSIYYYTYTVASWYIGAAICPINPTFKKYEMDNAIKLLKPKLYVCSRKTLSVVEQTIELSNESFLIVGEFPNEDIHSFEPEDLNPLTTVASIAMSSGTTGLPKGVVVTQDAMIGNIIGFGCYNQLAVSPGDSTIGLLPFYHTFGSLIGIGNFYFQLKLIVMEKFKPEIYLRCIQEYKVNKLYIVPPLALFLAKSPMIQHYDVSSVTDILCAAAPLTKDLQELLEKRLNTTVRQAYGLTECGFATITPYKSELNKIGSSGILTPETIAKVIDVEKGVELGPNETGELCFKSRRNMLCYFNNEEATNEAIDEEGFLHTGDIGYYDDEGYFFILDRLKDLIKCKGYQIAPAELEGILISHEAVKDVAVIGIPDERSGELPCALIVPEPERKTSEDELINFVSNIVSSYKHLSGGVIFVDDIPKNPSGKILRRRLKEQFVIKDKLIS